MTNKATQIVGEFLKKLKAARQEVAGSLAHAQVLLAGELNKVESLRQDPPLAQTGRAAPLPTEIEGLAGLRHELLRLKALFASQEAQLDKDYLELVEQLEVSILLHSEQLQRYDMAIAILEQAGAYSLAEVDKLLDKTIPLPQTAVVMQ